MIKIHYECDETEQTMDISIDLNAKEDGSLSVKVNFDPPVENDVPDPYGLALKLYNICVGNE